MLQLSIIIPTLNEERFIERTLQTVKLAAPAAEIVLVDGDSSDTTIARASRYARVIFSETRARRPTQCRCSGHPW